MKSAVRQGGSVKIFIIVGIVLVLVALGVLYGVKQFAMSDQTPPMVIPADIEDSEAPAEDDDVEAPAEDGDVPANEDAVDLPGGVDSSPEVDEETGATTDVDEGQTAAEGSSSQPVATPGDSRDDSRLPQSGPDQELSALALALVVASFVAYRRSLRHL